MNSSTLESDLVYVRDLAEAGRTAPLLGGRFLTWWGGLATLAYTLHFLIITEQFGLHPAALGWMWMSFGIIGVAGYIALVRTMSGDKPGMSSVSNQVEYQLWKICSLVLAVYFLALMLKAMSGQGVLGFAYSLPVVFAVYAVGLFGSGKIAKNRILQRASFLALFIVALAVWFQATYFIWAVAALGAFLTAFLPGLVLLRDEPKSVV